MSALASRFGRIPARWRWAALVAVVALAALLVWYFFLRPQPAGPSPAGPPPVRPALGQRIPYENYTAAVDQALADVRDARSLSGSDRGKKLEDAAKALEKVEGASVEPPGGGISEVDNTEIIGELRGSDPNMAALVGSLTALSEGLGEASSANTLAGTLGGEQAITELKKVLSDPAFNYERELSPLQRLARWLGGQAGQADPGDVLWRLFSALVAGLAGGFLVYLASERVGNRWARLGLAAAGGILTSAVFYGATEDLTVTVGVLGAIGLVVAAVAAGLISAGLYRSSAPTTKPRAVSDLAAALGMSAGEARKQAEEAAGAGDYRHAVRYRCLAVLLALDEVGMLAFDRTATDREYLFRAPGGLQEELQPLLTRFEEVWYGDASTTEADWADYAARAGRVEARVAAESRAGKQAAAGRSAA